MAPYDVDAVVENVRSVCLTLEVQEDTILTTESLALTDDDSWRHLLTQLWLTLLTGSHDHVTNAS